MRVRQTWANCGAIDQFYTSEKTGKESRKSLLFSLLWPDHSSGVFWQQHPTVAKVPVAKGVWSLWWVKPSLTRCDGHINAAKLWPVPVTPIVQSSKIVRTIEMKLKQNSFKTILKLFCFSFISMCGKFKPQVSDIKEKEVQSWLQPRLY